MSDRDWCNSEMRLNRLVKTFSTEPPSVASPRYYITNSLVGNLEALSTPRETRAGSMGSPCRSPVADPPGLSTKEVKGHWKGLPEESELLFANTVESIFHANFDESAFFLKAVYIWTARMHCCFTAAWCFEAKLYPPELAPKSFATGLMPTFVARRLKVLPTAMGLRPPSSKKERIKKHQRSKHMWNLRVHHATPC